ncbi:MAG: YHYH protein [Planctomycetota bacterium]
MRTRLGLAVGGMAIAFAMVTAAVLVAQGPGGRRHREVESRPVRLTPADQRPPADCYVDTEVRGDRRQIESNGIPSHTVGRFPNRGNPHAIRQQRYRLLLPAEPRVADRVTPLHLVGRYGPPNLPFGVAVNGVLIDPGTAEYWNSDRRANWNYEALGGAVALGIDTNHAHVQPSGAYHYHGLPTGLLRELGVSPSTHSPLVGWAADGFPVYAMYGFEDPDDADSAVVEFTSSYRLKPGRRPNPPSGPGGRYDGAFVQDYEFVDGAGTLDECSGRFTVTPDYPDGTYAYFLTRDWPVIPRAFRGTPINLRARR